MACAGSREPCRRRGSVQVKSTRYDSRARIWMMDELAGCARLPFNLAPTISAARCCTFGPSACKSKAKYGRPLTVRAREHRCASYTRNYDRAPAFSNEKDGLSLSSQPIPAKSPSFHPRSDVPSRSSLSFATTLLFFTSCTQNRCKMHRQPSNT